MVTVVGTRNFGRTDQQAVSVAAGTSVQCLYFQYDITTAAAATDTVTVGYLPAFAVPIGGWFSAADIDSGTESLDIDLGIAANGVDSVDTDFFMNGGIFTGDVPDDADFMGVPTNHANFRHFAGPFPVVQLGARTEVKLLFNAVAQAGGTGKLTVCILYLTPGKSTS